MTGLYSDGGLHVVNKLPGRISKAIMAEEMAYRRIHQSNPNCMHVPRFFGTNVFDDDSIMVEYAGEPVA